MKKLPDALLKDAKYQHHHNTKTRLSPCEVNVIAISDVAKMSLEFEMDPN